jgi:hypothetical protein
MEGRDQFGNYVTWYDYRFNPRIDVNRTATKKMKEYLEKETSR